MISRLLPSLAILLSVSAPVDVSAGMQTPARVGADTVDAPRTFAPDATLSPPGGPIVHLYSTGTSDVVALRISVPLREPEGLAGAGQILRAMAQARMESVGSRIGARVRVNHTPDALVYEVAGPEADLDFLAWVLREGLAEPDATRFRQFQRDALANVEQRLETPDGMLALRLRDALDPSTPPLYGRITALERLDPSRLRNLWARTHVRDQLRVVAVGNLAPEVALASIAELGLPPTGAAPFPVSDSPSAPQIPTPELVRHWVGEARTIEGERDPRTLVAARMITETLRAAPGDYEIGVELWEVDREWVLVLSGAAYPRSRAEMLQRVDGLIAEAAAQVTDDAVRHHVASVRAELLESARTPWGLADMVGHAMDAGEAPDRVGELLTDLESLGGEEMVGFFELLGAIPSIREEMNP